MDEIYWCRMWDTARGAEGRAIEGPTTYRAHWSFYDLLALMYPFSSANSELAFRIWWLSSLKIQNTAYANARHIFTQLTCCERVAVVFREFFGVTSTQPTQSEHGSADINAKKPAGFPHSVLTPDLSLSARGHFRHNLDPQPPSDWS